MPLALALFYALLRATWNAQPVPRGTGLLLVPSSAFLAIGWALLVFGPTAAWLTLTGFADLKRSAMANRVAFAAGCGTALLGVTLVLRAKRSFVFVNSRGLILKPAFSTFRHIAWGRVQTVEYRSVVGQLTFRSNRSSLAVGLMLRGLSALVDQVRISLPPQAVCRTLSPPSNGLSGQSMVAWLDVASAAQQAVEAGGRMSSPPAPSCFAPVVSTTGALVATCHHHVS